AGDAGAERLARADQRAEQVLTRRPLAVEQVGGHGGPIDHGVVPDDVGGHAGYRRPQGRPVGGHVVVQVGPAQPGQQVGRGPARYPAPRPAAGRGPCRRPILPPPRRPPPGPAQPAPAAPAPGGASTSHSPGPDPTTSQTPSGPSWLAPSWIALYAPPPSRSARPNGTPSALA